ncbi:hypothetical protein G3N55_09455 [Dissulfurirhabdus thermomarina]|uniref:RNA polymerase II-associated protein n=1 Tax=Dissulfurirhabdus thermomarina TaxID=1765737 RepID=A0A6N9TUE8_DISTH|nr:hypothetical protein [Dissulfurirhabdus thermomarina]NDY43067.1 hypothetical protein [Dissulfurirhabdus thermomarina]NMX22395.1 hypothetical protein [Dissulfurirhabdus thermomarina]
MSDTAPKGFCQKDNREVPLDEGCRHPKDYCQYRQACIVHFHERERAREREDHGATDREARCGSS